MVAELCEVKSLEYYQDLANRAPLVFEKFVDQLSTNLGLENLTTKNYFAELPNIVENLGIDNFKSTAVETMRNLRGTVFASGVCDCSPSDYDPDSYTNPCKKLLEDNVDEDGFWIN